MYKKYYNSNIQMHPKVIDDICKDCVHKKMLVWGLGYDTPLWWNVTNNNTYFVVFSINNLDLKEQILFQSGNNIISLVKENNTNKPIRKNPSCTF